MPGPGQMHPLSPGRLPAPPVEEDWNAPGDPLADLEAARDLMEPLGYSEAKFADLAHQEIPPQGTE